MGIRLRGLFFTHPKPERGLRSGKGLIQTETTKEYTMPICPNCSECELVEAETYNYSVCPECQYTEHLHR